MNSYIVNLYLKPTQNTTSQRLTPDASTVVQFGALSVDTKAVSFDIQANNVYMTIDGSTPSSTNGHLLYAGRAYTLSRDSAQQAKFISATSTAVIFASELSV
jgi:hypothetical protein